MMADRTYSKFSIKVGIMAASSVQMGAIALAAAIPLMMQHFQGASPTEVQTVITLPTLVCVPVSLLIGIYANVIGKKRAVVVGMLLMSLAGVLPVFFEHSLGGLWAVSAVIGIALGLIVPTSTGLITEYFHGFDRVDLLGKQSAFVNLGGMILSFLGGLFALKGWHLTYLIFIFPVIISFIVIFSIPKDKKASEYVVESGEKPKVPTEVFILSGFSLVFGVAFGVFSTNIAMLLAEKSIGNAAVAGSAASFMAGAGIVIGLLYGRIAAYLKNNIILVALLLLGVGLFIVSTSNSSAVALIGSVIVGMGFSTYIPSCLFKISLSVPPQLSTFAMSIFFASMNIAMFLSPIIMNPISISMGDGSAQFRFVAAAVCAVVLGVVMHFYLNSTKTKQEA